MTSFFISLFHCFVLAGWCFAVGESIVALDFSFHGYRVSCLRGRYRRSVSLRFWLGDQRNYGRRSIGLAEQSYRPRKTALASF